MLVLLALVAGLLVPTVISHRRGQHALNHALGLGVNSLVTVASAYQILRSRPTAEASIPPGLHSLVSLIALGPSVVNPGVKDSAYRCKSTKCSQAFDISSIQSPLYLYAHPA
jgi:hypothetical protein